MADRQLMIGRIPDGGITLPMFTFVFYTKEVRGISGLIKTHRFIMAFCGHVHKAQGQEWVGHSLVMSGSLEIGFYAPADTVERQAELKKLKSSRIKGSKDSSDKELRKYT